MIISSFVFICLRLSAQIFEIYSGVLPLVPGSTDNDDDDDDDNEDDEDDYECLIGLDLAAPL